VEKIARFVNIQFAIILFVGYTENDLVFVAKCTSEMKDIIREIRQCGEGMSCERNAEKDF
jgi:hypothetical protein